MLTQGAYADRRRSRPGITVFVPLPTGTPSAARSTQGDGRGQGGAARQLREDGRALGLWVRIRLEGTDEGGRRRWRRASRRGKPHMASAWSRCAFAFGRMIWRTGRVASDQNMPGV